MGISIPAGAFGPDPVGIGLEVGSNVYKGMREGETATWQQQQKFDEVGHTQAIQDMANLVEIHGPDAVNQPDFQAAYQRAHKAQYPTIEQPGAPGQPSTRVPAPLGGVDNSPTLASLGIQDPQLGNLTTRQAKTMGIDVSKLILDRNKPLTQSEYETQLIQKLNRGEPLNPMETEYAQGARTKGMGERTPEQVVLNWQMSHPNDDISTAPRLIQELHSQAAAKGRTPYDQAWENIRGLPGGISDPNANPLDVQTVLKGLGQEPKTMTQSQLIAKYVSDDQFRASLSPASRALIDELRKGKGTTAIPNVKFYEGYANAEIGLTRARMELSRAI